MDSLQKFPWDYPFNIKIANVYIRGGKRTSEGQKVLRRRRPRMTAEALKNLLQRHGKEIVEDAEAQVDKGAEQAFRAGTSGRSRDKKNN